MLGATLLLWGVWIVGGILAMLVGYLLLLTALACVAPRRTPLASGSAESQFAILVPAHNEELLLPELLDSLHGLDYPRDKYKVYVVADNCTDKTAQVARDRRAAVYERTDPEQRGKGYALQWLIAQLKTKGIAYDAAVIVDADSIVSANFLRVVEAQLRQGARVIQAYYGVRDEAPTGGSWSASLRAAALMVLHYLRPQGRMVMGASAGLKGNGMVFRRELLHTHEWSSSVTEDIEYHMTLILAGERVFFAPDAVVHAEMPTSLTAAKSQNVRWEQGRLESVRRYLPQLLRAVVQPNGRSRIILLDAIMEHLIPPFSILMTASLGYLLLALILMMVAGTVWPAVLAVALLTGQGIYLLLGMVLARAPRHVFVALLRTPLFLLWKMRLYFGVITKASKQDWVRTARNSAHTDNT